MNILLASASPTARKILRGILEKAGHAPGDLVEATERKATFEAIRDSRRPLDLAVVDWDMPELDGVALTRFLKATPGKANVGVLFCVGEGGLASAPGSVGPGPYEWIERPFTDAAFLKKFQALRQSFDKARADKSEQRLKAIASGKPEDLALPFLLQLPSGLIDDLLKKSIRQRHKPGTILLRVGETPEALHLVTRGEVEILEGTSGVRFRTSGEGDPYGELSFMTARPSEETVRAKTAVDTASVSKAELADVLQRHPRISGYLSSLLTRHSKTMTARATTLSHADFKGTLDATPFADLLQLLGSTRKTGVLGIRDDDRSGAIYLEDGEATHAWTEDLQGEEAFFALSSWKAARFAFRSIRRQEPRTLKRTTMILLLEAMRRQEEQSTPPAATPGPRRRPF